MDHQYFKDNYSKYLDNELSQAERTEFEKFLNENPTYKLELEKEEKFNKLVRNSVVKEQAPYELREAVINQIEKKGTGFSFVSFWQDNPLVKSLSVGALAVVLLFAVLPKQSDSFPVFSESISSHMEFLKGAYPMEITSGNKEEVAQWFEGKLNYAVQLPEFKDENVQLVGARLCHLKDKKVAFLNYRFENEAVSVFVVDMETLKVPKAKKIETDDHTFFVKSDKGYSSVLCLGKKAKGIGCVFVSMMEESKMMRLLI